MAVLTGKLSTPHLTLWFSDAAFVSPLFISQWLKMYTTFKMHELYFHWGFSESNFKAIQKEELCGLPSFKAYLRLFNIIKQSNLGDKDTGWSQSDFKDVIHHCLCCYSSSQLTKSLSPTPKPWPTYMFCGVFCMCEEGEDILLFLNCSMICLPPVY